MVPEEICDSDRNQIFSATINTSDKNWIEGIKEIQQKSSELNEKLRCDSETRNLEDFVRGIVLELCDSAVPEESVVRRNSNYTEEEIYKKKANRNTTVLENDLYLDPYYNNKLIRRRSVSECVIDENDNNVSEAYKNNQNLTQMSKNGSSNTMERKIRDAKLKKKFSINSLFHRKDKSKAPLEEDHSETYDTFDSSKSVTLYKPAKLKKARSALELSQPSTKLQRTPSFIKKLVQFKEVSTNSLKRSLSFRDINKYKDKNGATEKLAESREQKWKQSLQSLVESDISVSYKDLSFINYDALNDITYDDNKGSQYSLYRENSMRNAPVGRTQSMLVQRSPEFRRPVYQRLKSANEYDTPTTGLSQQSGATSLPSLGYINNLENGYTVPEPISPTHRYLRRPQSISSEDGGRSRSSASGSFRSAGSGCAKLKRHNACRQKNRELVQSLNIEIRRHSPNDDRTVRSRSLNHLDTLEMRQGTVSTADAALKDSRSEPDCTNPILVPGGVVNPEPPTPTADVPPARKYMLSRSQKSSSECFSVYFEVGEENTWENELFFPAQRGVTLHDSLAKMCELRNIDLSSCEARLLDKENNTETLIHFAQDTANLVGRQVRITAKDASNKKIAGSFHANHSRKPSGSYRPRTSSFYNTSTEDSTPVATSAYSLHDGDQSKKQIKQRFTAFFGNTKDVKLEALINQLDSYTKNGIPNDGNYPQGQCESVDALYKLEDDWKDIVDYADLNERQQQQQTVLWELIKTEVAYIKTLKVVTDLFLACLKDLQQKGLLKEIDTKKLFSNITEILNANVIFWRNTLFPLVRDMRKYKRPPCIENMLEGFSEINEVFRPYYIYCAEQSRCQHYCRDNLDSEFFTAYLTWCESQKDCNRLRLMDILVQPMQRLTKYGLLLKAILKNTDEDVEKDNITRMIKMVDDFVNKVNLSLKDRQDSERLKGIIARIESYDIVESKDDDVDRMLKKDKSLMQLDLTRPMINCLPDRRRHLLMEGDLKLKDSSTSKMEVHCFLLTDMLLICKPSTKKGGATVRVVRQPYLVDRLVVHELSRETPSLGVIYKNEFDMAVAVFILQSNDAKRIRGWKDSIQKAQSLYAQAKQTSCFADESLDTDYNLDYTFEGDYYHSSQLAPRSPLASSSRASRVSSLAHSHSGSVEMNDQSSIGSAKDPSRGVSVENDNRTASISSDEGVQPLPPDKSPVSQKNSFKNRLFHKTPNTLSVQPYGSLGQSLPNLTLGSPNVGSLSLNLNQNTLSVPNSKNGGQLLSPTHRGISYPPPSPTRGNLRRSLAISQNKNPPLVKTRQVNSASSVSSQQMPASFDFDVPVIAGVSHQEDLFESFSRGHHRQAMKRTNRYHTAGLVDDIKKNDNRDASIHKRLSWNCTSQEQRPPNEDQT